MWDKKQEMSFFVLTLGLSAKHLQQVHTISEFLIIGENLSPKLVRQHCVCGVYVCCHLPEVLNE